MCREHGQQLLKLSARDDAPFEGFEVFGVIKETGVDDEGLQEFYAEHFPFNLYRDVDLKFYEAFGNGSIFDGLSWNPFKLYRELKELGKRLKEKNLEGNMKGEGLTTGGVVIFSGTGEPKYMYKEETGFPLDEEMLLQAIQDVREGQMSSSKEDL